MIIKKWSGSAWVAQSAKVNYTDIVADVTAGTPVSIFEAGKLKEAYLPNSVFDSLKFKAAVSVNSPTAATFADHLQGIVDDAATFSRSAIGYYLVASNGGTVSQNTTGVQGTLSADDYFTWTFTLADGYTASPTSSGVLEAGDWMVINSITGTGSVGSPYAINFAVVNNTYEIMGAATAGVAGTPGLVPSSSAGDQAKFLRADATWQTITQNATHTGDVTGSTTLTIADNAVTTSKINNSAVTLAKMANLAANSIIGNNTGSAATPIALTASQVRTLLNVADGATANTGTVTSVALSLPTSIFDVSGSPVTSSGTLTATLDSQTANTIFAAPNGTAGTPTFRALVAADVPTLNQNTTGSAGSVTNAATFNNSGTGEASGTTYNGSAARTISYNTIGAAASSHAHGDITSGGLIQSTVVTPGSGDTIIIADSSATNAIKRGITIGTATTTFLRNDGTWGTPAGTSYTGGSGIGLTGTEFSVTGGEGITAETDGVRMTYPLYVQTATPSTSVTNAIWYDIN